MRLIIHFLLPVMMRSEIFDFSGLLTYAFWRWTLGDHAELKHRVMKCWGYKITCFI